MVSLEVQKAHLAHNGDQNVLLITFRVIHFGQVSPVAMTFAVLRKSGSREWSNCYLLKRSLIVDSFAPWSRTGGEKHPQPLPGCSSITHFRGAGGDTVTRESHLRKDEGSIA